MAEARLGSPVDEVLGGENTDRELPRIRDCHDPSCRLGMPEDLGVTKLQGPDGKHRISSVLLPGIPIVQGISNSLICSFSLFAVYIATTPLVWLGKNPDVLFASITQEPLKMPVTLS